MKSTAHNFLILAFCFLALACQANSKKQAAISSVIDPLIGLKLDLQNSCEIKVKESLLSKIGLNSDGIYWVLSTYQEAGLIYQIILGLHPIYEDRPDGKLLGFDTDYGSVIIQNQATGTYDIVGSADVVFDYLPDNPVGDVALGHLSDKYIDSLIKILGGKDQLNWLLKKSSIDLQTLPVSIQESIFKKTNFREK